jgi:uncharacterized membrane protein (UPF0127 family)
MRSFLVCSALLVCCASAQAPTTAKQDVSTAQKPRVFVGGKDGSTVQITVEVVDTPESRAVGLMNRNQLAEDAGMLFLFPRESVQTFWMKNTLIPLDMVFIRADMSVAGVVENAVPMTETPRSVNEPSQFVLEVVGGYCQKHGIAAGSRVRFEGVPAAPKE